MQTTFIGPDGQEYSLDQVRSHGFEAHQESGVWYFTFFDHQTKQPASRYRGTFPTAFDRDRWIPNTPETATQFDEALPFALPTQPQSAA
jgi:hypothetical protein